MFKPAGIGTQVRENGCVNIRTEDEGVATEKPDFKPLALRFLVLDFFLKYPANDESITSVRG